MTIRCPTAVRLFIALGLASVAVPAVAQSGERGKIPVVVTERCAACHIASKFHDDDTGIDAPRFSEIMAKPDVYTAERLRLFLADPHWPMSQFILSPKDIDRIIVYLTGETPPQ